MNTSLIKFLFLVWIIIILHVFLKIFKNSNPMSICLNLLAIMVFFSLSLNFIYSVSWISLIFLMILIGGILILYMIMSTMITNNYMKTESVEFKSFLMMTFTILMIVKKFNLFFMETDYMSINFKSMILSEHLMVSMILILSLYFFSITLISLNEELSLRSFFCLLSNNFVNYP